MKKSIFTKSLMAIALLCMPFALISCSEDEEGNDGGSNGQSTPVTAYMDLSVETNDALRAIADLTLFYTDFEGNQIYATEGLTSEGSNQNKFVVELNTAISRISFPVELTVVLEMKLKEGAADGSYTCSYKIRQNAGTLNASGEVISFGSASQNKTWTPRQPLSENFPDKRVETKLTLEKDENGNIVIKE